MKIKLMFLCCLLIPVVAVGCSGEDTRSVSGSTQEPASDNATTGDVIPTEELVLGKKLFDRKCRVCHSIKDKTVLGPGLAGIADRKSTEWLARFVADPQAVWTEGGSEVQELKKRVGREDKPGTRMKLSIRAKDIPPVISYIQTL